MKKTILNLLLTIFIFIFVLCSARPAIARAGVPRLEISPERLNPGAALEIRGVDFEFGQNVILALVNSQIEIPLAAIMSDVEGVFLLTVTLPADLAEGSYTVRARTYDHDIHSPPITVSGIAAQEGGGQGEREEDDGLLAPMPTFPPATLVLSNSSADSVTAPGPEAPSRLPIIVVGVLVAVGVAILGIRLRNNC